jgi:hypothetical protein
VTHVVAMAENQFGAGAANGGGGGGGGTARFRVATCSQHSRGHGDERGEMPVIRKPHGVLLFAYRSTMLHISLQRYVWQE